MPTRRFWCLEGQINRLLSEKDLRFINANRATGSAEQMGEVIERLTLEIGETYKIKRESIVQASTADKAKLKSLFGR